MSFKSYNVQSTKAGNFKKYLNSISFQSRYTSGLLFMGISATAFGSAPTFAKLAFDNSINPSSLQSYRFLITFIVILFVAIITKTKLKVTRSHLPRLFTLALSTGLSSFCYMTSVNYIPVAIASLTFFTFPLVVAPISHLLGMDKLSPLKVAAMLIAFSGLCLLMGNSYQLNWHGIAMAFAAGLFVATSFIVSKPLTNDLSPITLAVFATGMPCIAYLTISFTFTTLVIPYTLAGCSGLIVNSLCHALGLTCCYAAIARLGALRTAVMMNIEPLISALAAYLVLNQFLTIYQILGVCGVVFGIAVMSSTKKS